MISKDEANFAVSGCVVVVGSSNNAAFAESRSSGGGGGGDARVARCPPLLRSLLLGMTLSHKTIYLHAKEKL